MSKNIQDLYAEYEIPSWLALHMQRVAAVAATLFDAHAALPENSNNPSFSAVARTELLAACLLHDMGNIIKFNFEKLLLSLPEDKAHWQEVQNTMIDRYGSDEHVATLAMLDAIGVSDRVKGIVDGIGFTKCEAIDAGSDILVKIAQYADARVCPNGVVSLQERLADMYVRYAHKHKKDDAETVTNTAASFRIEQFLFSPLSIKPQDITESSLASLRDSFEKYTVC